MRFGSFALRMGERHWRPHQRATGPPVAGRLSHAAADAPGAPCRLFRSRLFIYLLTYLLWGASALAWHTATHCTLTGQGTHI